MRSSSTGLASGTLGSPQQTIEQTEYSNIVQQIESELESSMPNHSQAITPVEKFVNYSLNPSNPNSKGKAEAYEKGLGYTKSNASGLIEQIHSAVSSGASKPYDVTQSEYGIKFKYRILVIGPNGKAKNVIAVYQIDAGHTTPRLITNYLEGK